MPWIFVLLVLCDVLCDFGSSELTVQSALGSSAPPTGLGCHRRLYTYRITQSDESGEFHCGRLICQERWAYSNFLTLGHECWDHISVWSCWGRCDSREISDWKFPYKKSYHPVCVHASRSKAVAHLRYCHPLAAPSTRRYEYLEADACHCQVRFSRYFQSVFVPST